MKKIEGVNVKALVPDLLSTVTLTDWKTGPSHYRNFPIRIAMTNR